MFSFSRCYNDMFFIKKKASKASTRRCSIFAAVLCYSLVTSRYWYARWLNKWKHDFLKLLLGMLLRTFRQTHMVLANFSKLGFTPCKTEQPLQGMEFKGKKSTKRLKHTGNLFRKNLYVNSRFYHRSNETILWIEHRHPCNI